MDYNQTINYISKDYEESVLPNLSEFIKIENISPSYDTSFFSNGIVKSADEMRVKRPESFAERFSKESDHSTTG